jgi:hypothetical protein
MEFPWSPGIPTRAIRAIRAILAMRRKYDVTRISMGFYEDLSRSAARIVLGFCDDLN